MTTADRGTRFLSGYGLVNAPLAHCSEAIRDARLPRRSVLRLSRETASRDQVVDYLSHLTVPPTRLALFAAARDWTAVVTNERDGSDFDDYREAFGRLTRARTVRVVDHAESFAFVRGVRERRRYAARIFELFDAAGEPVRSITCADDGGRWVFETVGEPLPPEASFNYGARRKRDRFTHENLGALLAWLGIPTPIADAFEQATRFELVREDLADQEWAARVEACTPEQADDPGYGYFQRGLGWVEFMETHAESVAWDLTKAVFLNPSLAEGADEYLRAARRRLGRGTFNRIQREALSSFEFTTSSGTGATG